jgi:cytochrome b561
VISNTKTSWGLVSVLFHWIMAVLFLGQFGLGWYMQGVSDMLAQYHLYQWHKSFGFTILGLAALRLAWTLVSLRPSLPVGMAEGEKRLALATHWLLYLALFVVPLTGWAVVSTSPLPIASWYFGLFVVPSLPLGISVRTEQIWSSLHGFLAYAAIFLAAVHILAALRHHFHHRDATLLKMLRPGYDGRGEGASDTR